MGLPIIFEDNTGAIAMAETRGNHRRVKHLNLRINFVGEAVTAKQVKLVKVDTKEQVADMMTKALSKKSLVKFRALAFGSAPLLD